MSIRSTLKQDSNERQSSAINHIFAGLHLWECLDTWSRNQNLRMVLFVASIHTIVIVSSSWHLIPVGTFALKHIYNENQTDLCQVFQIEQNIPAGRLVPIQDSKSTVDTFISIFGYSLLMIIIAIVQNDKIGIIWAWPRQYSNFEALLNPCEEDVNECHFERACLEATAI
jgi:hypothetical protein